MNHSTRKLTLWTLRQVSTEPELTAYAYTQTLFASFGFSVSVIITLYFYPLEAECVDPDYAVWIAQAGLLRYIP